MPTLSAKLNFTLESAPSHQRPFAEQRGGQRKRNLKCFSDILVALSGGDPVCLLLAFFSSREGRPLLEQLGLESKDTLQRLVEALRSLHASASRPEDKRAILAALSAVFSRVELWQYGFEFSPATLTRARKSTQTGNPNVSISQSAVPRAQPNPAISNSKSLALRLLETHSREAANRTVTLKRKACNDPDGVAYDGSKKRHVVAARYLDDSRLQLFNQFKADHPEAKMSRSTFYNLVPEHYKKASKLTDLCNVCEAGKRDEMALRSLERRQGGSEASGVQRDASERLQSLQHRIDYYRMHKRLYKVQRGCYTSEAKSRTRYRCT